MDQVYGQPVDGRHVIEAVCVGNSGRSPVLETLLKAEAQKLGLEDEVLIVSSGTQVISNYKQENFDNVWFYIERGMEVGIMNDYLDWAVIDTLRALGKNSAREFWDEAILDPTRIGGQLIREASAYARNRMTEAEQNHRRRFLEKHGLKYNGTPTQTFACHDGLILTMNDDLVSKVKEIYSSTDMKPIITPVMDFAGVPESMDGAYGRGYAMYEARAMHLKMVAPVVLRKALHVLDKK